MIRVVRTACAALGVSLLFLSGCYRSAPASQFPNAEALLGRLKQGQACSRALRGEAEFDYRGEEGRRHANLLYFTELPDSLRLDIFSNQFGMIVSTLTSNGKNFTLFDLPKKSFLRGPASACNLERLTRVPVPPHAFVGLLRGDAPVLVHNPAESRVTWEKGAYSVRIQSRHRAEEELRLVPVDEDFELDWSKQRVRLLGVHVRQAGRTLYRVELSRHARFDTARPRVDPDGIDPPIPPSGPECHAELPRGVRFIVGDGVRDVLLVNQELAHNPPLVSGVFEQEPPPGVSTRTVTCTD